MKIKEPLRGKLHYLFSSLREVAHEDRGFVVGGESYEGCGYFFFFKDLFDVEIMKDNGVFVVSGMNCFNGYPSKN